MFLSQSMLKNKTGMLITHSINQNERLHCIFVDFTKVFDFVVLDILCI